MSLTDVHFLAAMHSEVFLQQLDNADMHNSACAYFLLILLSQVSVRGSF